MILTPDERRALLGLLSLLVLGQGVALLRDERKARPDRELSAWLTRAQAARAESLGADVALAGAASGAVPEAVLRIIPGVSDGGKHVAVEYTNDSSESAFEMAVADSTISGPGADAAPTVPIESASIIPAGVAATGRLAINRASARDLEALPGIGPSLAKRIVEEREKAGPFRSPRDLLRVKGIGPKKQAAIQDRIDWSL
jgi:competence protein ComEA